MKKLLPFCTVALALSISPFALAKYTANVAITSDYTVNGISQTSNDPAFQAGFDYNNDKGFYLGTWGSSVKFDQQTDAEIDLYLGKVAQLNSALSVDYGIIYYSYHGHSSSSNSDYAEVYSKFSYQSALGTTEANMWYAWDYAGTGAKHVIAMLAHNVELTEGHWLRASVDVSNSLNANKFAWRENQGKSYWHYRLAYQTQLAGFDFTLAAENTNINSSTADERLVFSISKGFSL